MINQHTVNYLTSLIPPRGEKIEEIELYAKENHIPIMDILGMESLLQQLRLIQPKRILEIGTAIGYSAIRMATSFPEAKIVSIERDPIRYEEAIKNISRLKVSHQIEVRLGDALEIYETLENVPSFDVLFIDAAKAQYKKLFNLYSQYIKRNGVVFSDNVLFRGFVGQHAIENKRMKNIAQKIEDYNHWLMKHEGYETRILPLGDGLAVSIKR